jgi:hypothetical protein
MTPLSSCHSSCLHILALFTSVLSNQHYHAPCGLLLAAFGTSVAQRKLVSRAPLIEIGFRRFKDWYIVSYSVHNTSVLVCFPSDPAQEIKILLRWRGPTLFYPVSHHVCDYPKYCHMASWWPYMELRTKGPLFGNPDRIHAQYPGDTFSRPFPNFPSLPTFCYPVHECISFYTLVAEGRVCEPDGMLPLIRGKDMMDNPKPVRHTRRHSWTSVPVIACFVYVLTNTRSVLLLWMLLALKSVIQLF